MSERKSIPAPPGPDAGWEEQAAYFERFSPEDLEAAGYNLPLESADKAEAKALQQSAKEAIAQRTKRYQLNLTIGPEEIQKFQALAKKRHIPPSTLARAWFLERLDNELAQG